MINCSCKKFSQKENNSIQEIFIDYPFCIRFCPNYYVPQWSLEPGRENRDLMSKLSVKIMQAQDDRVWCHKGADLLWIKEDLSGEKTTKIRRFYEWDVMSKYAVIAYKEGKILLVEKYLIG